MKALVVFGTRWGGTTEVAKTIAETLRGQNYSVSVANAKLSNLSLADQDLVIIGSGIRADQWTK